jgi:leucyl aminopeptidase
MSPIMSSVMSSASQRSCDASTPILLVSEANWPDMAASLPDSARSFAHAAGFTPRAGRILPLPGEGGRLAALLFGIGSADGVAENPFLLAKLLTDAPEGSYHFASPPPEAELVMIGLALGAYQFDRFKSSSTRNVTIEPPAGVDMARVAAIAESIQMGRDLINRPANDLTPDALAEVAHALAAHYGAHIREVKGDALLKEGYPLIHAVGRAGAEPPRLVDIRWGNPAHPMVTLVGKGVVFDTGGLNIKPDASMLLMKKDMGGAAVALTLARMVMALGLKLRLRVLVPIVENAIAGNAFRPGDIYRSRKGLSVEIGNTDAEGRLVLADALVDADAENPGLLLNFATLTGAARVALGPDLPAFFTADEALAAQIAEAGLRVRDPVWRLPLWQPYQAMLDSKVADMNNVSSGGFAGAITAALFLKSFVTQTASFAHFDLYGWNPTAQPGKPVGGEPQVARLALSLIESRLKQ